MKTTAKRPSIASLPKTQLALRVLWSGEAGLASRPSHPLPVGPTRIGRALSGAGLLLDQDDQVSRLHATLHREPEGMRIVDEGSRNGTFVNGRPVAAGAPGSPLAEGDVVRVGDSFLLVRSEPLLPGDADIPTLIGRSPAARALRLAIKQVAPTPAMVLLLGESGTGKEVVARAIHALSGRSGPFIAVNCGAIPESLAESQLFGHLRGAFTGATPHPGYFRAAHGGTLFLDEVGELTPALQPKLLRALEEKAVVPVGATQPQPCDVRIIAATNRVLSQAVTEGRFRGDLLARLCEFSLSLPPLRERREDILPIAWSALRPAGVDGSQAPRLHPDLVERLLLYAFPYNVRELLKIVTELQIRGGEAPVLGPELLADRLDAAVAPPAPPPERPSTPITPPGTAATPPPPAPPPGEPTSKFQRGPIPSESTLRALLTKHKGVVAGIAKEMQRSRAQVYRWLLEHNLNADDFRD
jgi:transcriptional regulator with PAS, ATPase and Fis domain